MSDVTVVVEIIRYSVLRADWSIWWCGSLSIPPLAVHLSAAPSFIIIKSLNECVRSDLIK